MNRFDVIFNVAEICYRKDVHHVVLCPGSRCAPLTLAFSRHPKITVHTISDERSAAFIAMGIAQETRRPVIVVCTSGTAAYNLAPAVAESFFQEIPLLLFTADRPAEWIGHQDGQTIFQKDLYGRHVRGAFDTMADSADDYEARVYETVVKALELACSGVRGPVHVNFPFSEPLYPEQHECPSPGKEVHIMTPSPTHPTLDSEIIKQLTSQWTDARRVLLLAGQTDRDAETFKLVENITQKFKTPLLADITANLHGCGNLISRADLFLSSASPALLEQLRPDLLITFGKSVLSKSVKVFLRKYKPKHHWHIRPEGPIADTFRSQPFHIVSTPTEFFEAMLKVFSGTKDQGYMELWQNEDLLSKKCVDEVTNDTKLTELGAVAQLIRILPPKSTLHLANSMSVRYANYESMSNGNEVSCFSNRGTSGIDGCSSTAVGHALSHQNMHILITGDIAFFYDRNAFWHNYPIDNLRILLLNNHGGLIFDLIDGPASVPEKTEFFITHQRLNAKSLCREYGFTHLSATTSGELTIALKAFLQPGSGTTILEIETSAEVNRGAINKLKTKIKNEHET